MGVTAGIIVLLCEGSLTAAIGGDGIFCISNMCVMANSELSVLLAKLKEDAEFREKLQSTEDLDAAEALVQEAGFAVSKADWLKYQEE
ncbi:MAG: Nif11-like leader peptide family natural product precursor, partial [Cyanobacteriota bacterium]